jgi:hypothetical protein
LPEHQYIQAIVKHRFFVVTSNIILDTLQQTTLAGSSFLNNAALPNPLKGMMQS